jgi:hypothetical protein
MPPEFPDVWRTHCCGSQLQAILGDAKAHCVGHTLPTRREKCQQAHRAEARKHSAICKHKHSEWESGLKPQPGTCVQTARMAGSKKLPKYRHTVKFEVLTPRGCYAVWSGRSLSTFQRCLIALIINAVSIRETSVKFYRSIRCNNPEHKHLHASREFSCSQVTCVCLSLDLSFRLWLHIKASRVLREL